MADDYDSEPSDFHEGGPVKSFLEHLEDFRWVMVKSVVALFLAMLLCLIGANYVIGIVKWPLKHASMNYPITVWNHLLGWAQPVELEKKRTRWHVAPEAPAAPTLFKLFATQTAVKWHGCSWKAADGQTRHTRLAWMRVYLPGALDRGAQTLEELWLVVDWPEGAAEAYHYYLAHLHREPTVARCLRRSRSRWHIEQYFQRSKDDLGLDHFEGRSWRGFHHHLVMAVLAYLFVVVVFLDAKKNCLHSRICGLAVGSIRMKKPDFMA